MVLDSLHLMWLSVHMSEIYEPPRPGSAPSSHRPATDSDVKVLSSNIARNIDAIFEEQHDAWLPMSHVSENALNRSLKISAAAAAASEVTPFEIFPWQSQVFEHEWGKAVTKSCELSFAGSRLSTSADTELDSGEELGGLMRSNRRRLKQMKDRSKQRWMQELPPLVSATDLLQRSLAQRSRENANESDSREEVKKGRHGAITEAESIEMLQRRAFPMYYTAEGSSSKR